MARNKSTLSDSEIGQLVRREIDLAVGEDGQAVSEINRASIAYYEGRMASAPEGRSQVVSYDVADTIHALMANMQLVMVGSTVEFPPQNEEDEPQAQLESNVIRSVLENNDLYKTLNNACFDALLQQNGWLKIYVDEKEVFETQRFYSIGDSGIAQLIESYNKRNVRLNIVSSRPANDGVESDEPLFDITVRKVTTTSTLEVEVIPPENIIFSNRTDADEIEQLIMVGERKFMTVSELIALGVDEKKALALPRFEVGQTVASQERNQKQSLNDSAGSNQDATTLKQVYCVYMQLDLNQNNESELYFVMLGRNTSDILLKEPAPFAPYVTGSAVPMPHRIIGQSIYEMQKQIQDVKTQVLRQYLDNLECANNSRLGYVEGKVNLDDLLNGRVNGVIGLKHPDALVPLPNTDISMQCITGLQYMDEVRSQRGGAALDMSMGEMQIAQSSAAAAVGEFDQKEKLSKWFLSNLANSLLRGAFLLIHKTLRLNYHDTIMAKVGGQWQEVDPSSWIERKHATCRAGMTSIEKTKRVNMLSTLMTKQESWIGSGQDGIITDRSKLFNTASDWIRTSDLGIVDEYLIDPDSEQAQQVQQQQQQQQQQQEAMMQQLQQQQQQMEVMLKRMDDATSRWTTEQELNFKYFAEIKDGERQEAGLILDQVDKMQGKGKDREDASDKG